MWRYITSIVLLLVGAALCVVQQPVKVKAQFNGCQAGFCNPPAASAAVQTPSQIFGANLTVWLDAHTGVSVSGSNLTGWTDQSGNSHSIIGTEGTAPTYSATGFNSGPGISVTNGTNPTDANTAGFTFGGPASISLFVVLNVTTPGTNGRLVELYDPTGHSDFDDPNGIECHANTNSIACVQNSQTAGPITVTTGANARFGVVVNGTTMTPYANGSAGSGTTITSTTFGTGTNAPPLYIGGHAFSPAAFTIAELVFINRAASAGEITSLDNWFRHNWGL